MQKLTFKIEIEKPASSSVSEMKKYIKEALIGWKRGFDTEDELFYIDDESITIKHVIEN